MAQFSAEHVVAKSAAGAREDGAENPAPHRLVLLVAECLLLSKDPISLLYHLSPGSYVILLKLLLSHQLSALRDHGCLRRRCHAGPGRTVALLLLYLPLDGYEAAFLYRSHASVVLINKQVP